MTAVIFLMRSFVNSQVVVVGGSMANSMSWCQQLLNCSLQNLFKADERCKKKRRQWWNYCVILYIIIMTTLEDAILDIYFTISSLHPNCLQHMRSGGQGVIVCKSHATHWAFITCGMSCATWYEGAAQLLSLTEFILALFYWLKLSTDKVREETGVPRENPWQWASEYILYRYLSCFKVAGLTALSLWKLFSEAGQTITVTK